jgi:hypothetical protein
LSWKEVHAGGNCEFLTLHFSGALGVAGGLGGCLLVSFDHGENWISRPKAPSDLFDLRLLNPDTGYAVTGFSGHLLRTVDGGQAWTSLPYGQAAALFSLDFPDSQTGYAAGADLLLRIEINPSRIIGSRRQPFVRPHLRTGQMPMFFSPKVPNLARDALGKKVPKGTPSKTR